MFIVLLISKPETARSSPMYFLKRSQLAASIVFLMEPRKDTSFCWSAEPPFFSSLGSMPDAPLAGVQFE